MPASDRKPLISVVIPCFNESANIGPLFARLLPTLRTLEREQGLTWEVICVDDGSQDDTLTRLLEVARDAPGVRILELSRNFGKEPALSAGLSWAMGDAVVPMDADLQHPPEVLADMVAAWRQGFDVVVAVRDARTGQSAAHQISARLFYWLFDHMSEVKLPREAGDFRLMDRRVISVINQMPERTRFMKGIFAWVGFRQTSIPYHQAERTEGVSHLGFFRLLRLSLDGLTAFSTLPLRVGGVLGALVSGVAFLYIVVRLLRTLLYGVDVPGYESLIVTILFLGGIQLLALGVIGDYLGRVFAEAKGRPLFIVREAYGYPAPESPRPLPSNRPFPSLPPGQVMS